MAETPCLKGKVTKEMVKKIGSGSYAAEYVPWSKISELLQQFAPGWLPECVANREGDLIHKAPTGGYLMIRFVHLDGSTTPAFPQAIMDNRHKSIPYDKISSRDVTDTQRRGFCLAAGAVFGLGLELWTRDPLEHGYSGEFEASTPETSPKPATAGKKAAASASATSGGTSEATEEAFREAALAKGVDTRAIDIIIGKLNGKWSAGLKTLQERTAEELNAKYAPAEEEY
jgi:hypothetical protein